MNWQLGAKDDNFSDFMLKINVALGVGEWEW